MIPNFWGKVGDALAEQNRVSRVSKGGGGHSYEKNVSKPKVAKSVSVRFKGVLHLKKDIQTKIKKIKLRRKEVERD